MGLPDGKPGQSIPELAVRSCRRTAVQKLSSPKIANRSIEKATDGNRANPLEPRGMAAAMRLKTRRDSVARQ